MIDYNSDQIDTAVDAAATAFKQWSTTDGITRARFINALADALEANSETLVPLADKETHLGSARLTGELARTTFQLRKFAQLASDGVPFSSINESAIAEAPPVGRPSMALVKLPLGPIAMFSSSNFPFAFSVLGGDTASALAAGCTVIVKAHAGHPELSRAVFDLITQTLLAQNLPANVVTFIEGAGNDVGAYLIQHPKVAAGAFTGSTRGGVALQKLINERPRPIPFYGELGAVNPVIALPHALADGGKALAQTLAGSIAMGAGQFCTNPGTLVTLNAPETDTFIAQLAESLAVQTPHAMLTAGMRTAYDNNLVEVASKGAEVLVNAPQDAAPSPFLAQVTAAQYIATAELREEIFGPSCLIIRCDSQAEVLSVLEVVEGSLTVTIWGAEKADDSTQTLVRSAMDIAGRVLFKGVPTGVAVTASQHHGGPFPSSTAPMTTSVGDAALARFLRPVCLQDAPSWLTALQGKPC
ncbi:aldehyde dehydrogenase (NADP(+)) [Leucothrix arctica]|uniref:Aldehyde dehydrogenase n=1 Tax=Leucothrix arctica TaxID=1481894 RepID=A0A317CT16_9GAMM|nr:aldehyde dehydrogenase (NADP(+)) [Leucothrix arctica]PWQ99580.1 aldehyde dehydrogenase [Leucothrix arctica]